MNKIQLVAQKRKVFGRKIKSLRKDGILPANIYGKKIKSLSVQVSTKDFLKLFKETGETNIIDLKVDKEAKSRPVLATNLQKHPVDDLPLHIDFHQVDLSQKVTVAIPIEITGESPAVKEKGAVLFTLIDEIKVEALPKDLPDKFLVDISKLQEFNDSILVKDLGANKNKVNIIAEEDEVVVMVQEPKKEEEAEPQVTQEEAESEEEKSEEEEAKETKAEEKQEDIEEKTKKQKKE